MKKLLLFFAFLFPSMLSFADTGYCENTLWDKASYFVLRFSLMPRNEIEYNFGNKSLLITMRGGAKEFQFLKLDPNVLAYTKSPGVKYTGSVSETVTALIGKFRLVNYFLNKAYPQGPKSIKGKSAIDLQSQTHGIRFQLTPSDFGAYAAPWSAQGHITPVSQNHYQYEIDFKFHDAMNPKEAHAMKLVGEISSAPRVDYVVPNSFALTNFEVFSGGENVTGKAKTVGQLKRMS